MSVTNANTKILNLKEFLETEFENNLDFILSTVKGLSNIPLDFYGENKYTMGHRTLGRILFCADKDPELIPYAILWDFSYALESHSKLTGSREVLYSELLNFYGLTPISEAQLIPVKGFDNLATTDLVDYMVRAVGILGYFIPSSTVSTLVNTIKGYLNNGSNKGSS